MFRETTAEHRPRGMEPGAMGEIGVAVSIKGQCRAPQGRSAMKSGRFEIEIHRDLESVDSDWALLEERGLSTPFQTRAWLRPVYEVLAPELGASTLFVLVRDAASGDPAMLLPLCVRRRLGVAVVEFADFGVCDYNAPLLSPTFDPGHREWAALWSDIVALIRFAPVMRFVKLPATIQDRVNPLVLDGRAREMAFGCWGVPLPSRIEDFDARVLASKFGRNLARGRRRLAERGKLEYVTAATREEALEIFAALARQRQARCDEMGRRNSLADPTYRRFYEAAIAEGLESRLTSVSALKLDGRIIGAMLALRHGPNRHVLMPTFEGGEWKPLSLGNILIREAIEQFIAEGARYFDLTIGDEAYKRAFGASREPLYHDMRPLTALGKVVSMAAPWAIGLKEALSRRNRPRAAASG
jgi:CelD/BcsL family acetyltransferase involved in cellulose biosynthesis